MEDQATEKKVGKTYEDKLADDRKGLDIAMPDVEVVSGEAPQVEESNTQEEGATRLPSEITAEANSIVS